MWFVVYHFGKNRIGEVKKFIVAIFPNYPLAEEYISKFGDEYRRRYGYKLYDGTSESLNDVLDDFYTS